MVSEEQYTNLAKNMKRFMAYFDVSYTYMASELGISKQMVSSLVKGNGKFTRAYIIAFSFVIINKALFIDKFEEEHVARMIAEFSNYSGKEEKI